MQSQKSGSLETSSTKLKELVKGSNCNCGDQHKHSSTLQYNKYITKSSIFTFESHKTEMPF